MSTDFITMQCPNCGGKLNIDNNSVKLRCENCGTELLVKRSAEGILLESFAKCPICNRNDQSIKVLSIIKSQVQKSETITYQTRTTYKTGLYSRIPVEEQVAVPIQTVQMTELAKQLQPPEKPFIDSTSSNSGTTFSILLIIGGIILSVIETCCSLPSTLRSINTSIETNNSNDLFSSLFSISMCYCISIIPLLIGIILYRYSNPRHKKAMEEKAEASRIAVNKWEFAMDRYNRLYYCQRDDCVYVQGENVAVPASQMNELLFKT